MDDNIRQYGEREWVKDKKYSDQVKDQVGNPGFSLVNVVTGQALRHAPAVREPVQMVPYNRDVLDINFMWSESHDLGDGHRAIRMANNILLNLDIFHGDSNVHDASTLVLWEWNEGANQRWRIVPYFRSSISRYSSQQQQPPQAWIIICRITFRPLPTAITVRQR
ncbi:UNVERIFIED_CONTAM: Ricin B-like lectin R40G3 [Sesamum radiatum]|uniref:Ricin B-like lectin R40G3 n=1 Tax=Sesamum radiatum TaxID=300843 RepID=A0AAW2SK26_SESRA